MKKSICVTCLATILVLPTSVSSTEAKGWSYHYSYRTTTRGYQGPANKKYEMPTPAFQRQPTYQKAAPKVKPVQIPRVPIYNKEAQIKRITDDLNKLNKFIHGMDDQMKKKQNITAIHHYNNIVIPKNNRRLSWCRKGTC